MSESIGRRVRAAVTAAVKRVVTPAEPAAWLQVGKAAVSTAAAWEIARVTTDSAYPVFAPLAAMLTVQATVVESLRTGIQRTVGVVAGVLLAFLLASALGVHWWSVGLLVFLGLLIGQSLALGSSGSTQIAVSALLVLVLAAGNNRYAADRILDTLIGAAVGMIVSLLLVPPLHVRDSGAAVRRFAESLADVLTATAESLRGSWPGTDTAKCLERARTLKAELVRTREDVDRGDDSIRYNVRSRGNAPVVSLHRSVLTTLEHGEIMVLGITRTLADEAAATARDEQQQPPLPDDLRGQLVTVLLGAATTLRHAGRAVVDEEDTVAAHGVLEALHKSAADTDADARSLVRAARTRQLPARQWLVLGSVITDLRRLLAELDERGEPLGFTLRSRRRGDGRMPQQLVRRRTRRRQP